jgi:hypothetical protein
VSVDNPNETMARAIHAFYRELARKGGWSKPATDRDFDDLDDFYKNSSRAAAKRMFSILALARLDLVSGNATVEEEHAIRAHIEYRLETLAEAEHDGWMEWHFSQGWRYGSRRDDEKKLHNCLRPYLQLPPVET